MLGGAAIVMFGTVAVIGIQTLSRVDFHDDRNVIIVAVSLGLAMIPVAFPTFYQRFGPDVQTIVGSGITMGSLSAIVLNLAFNVLQRKPKAVEVAPVGPALARRGQRARRRGVRATRSRRSSRASTGSPSRSLRSARSTASTSCGARSTTRCSTPTTSAALADRPPTRTSRPRSRWARSRGATSRTPASTASTRSEYERFDELNDAYRAKFGHPFLICVRENTKDSILDSFERRLQNTPRQEQMAALVEIGKIANLRLLDLVEDDQRRCA